MFETIYVSRHAKARAQEVWPCIGVRGIRRMLVETFEVDRGLAASFLGRRLEDVADIYRVAPDLTGLFHGADPVVLPMSSVRLDRLEGMVVSAMQKALGEERDLLTLMQNAIEAMAIDIRLATMAGVYGD